MSCYCEFSVALLHGAMGWCAVCIVVFPDHTRLLLEGEREREREGGGVIIANLQQVSFIVQLYECIYKYSLL